MMWVGERQRRILDLIAAVGRIEAEAMALHLQVSRETIRRDLKHLEESGRVRRVHGGAVAGDAGSEKPFLIRRRVQVDAKRRIGHAATALLRPGLSCFIDAGTTTAAFAGALKIDGVTIITNSIEVASILRAKAGVEVVLLGGRFGADVPSTSGELTMSQIERFRADLAILSPAGIDPVGGVTYHVFGEAEIARAMMARAQATILLADHTKCGTVRRAAVCSCADLEILVTDAAPAVTEAYREAGVRRVVVAARGS